MYSSEPQYQAFAEVFNVNARPAFLRSVAAVPAEQHAAYRRELAILTRGDYGGVTQTAAFHAIKVSPEKRGPILDPQNLAFADQDAIKGSNAKGRFLLSAAAFPPEPEQQAAYRRELAPLTRGDYDGVTQEAAFLAIKVSPEKRGPILDPQNLAFADQDAIQGFDAKYWFLLSAAAFPPEPEQQAAYLSDLRDSKILDRDGDTQMAVFKAIARSPIEYKSLLGADKQAFEDQQSEALPRTPLLPWGTWTIGDKQRAKVSTAARARDVFDPRDADTKPAHATSSKSQRELELEAEIRKYHDVLAERSNSGETAGRAEHNRGDSLRKLGDLTNDPAHYIEGADAYSRALNVEEYATGKIAGDLEDNLAYLGRKLGDLSVKDNPDNAKKYYEYSIKRTQIALKKPMFATGKTVGRLNDDLGRSFRELGDLYENDKNPNVPKRYYNLGILATQRGLKETAYAAENKGKLEESLGLSFIKLGDMTNDPTHYKKSSDAYRRALEDRTYATGETAGRLRRRLANSLLASAMTEKGASSEPFYIESIEQFSAALNVDEFATGRMKGVIRFETGLALNQFGTQRIKSPKVLMRLYDELSKKPHDAKELFEASIAQLERATDVEEYATGWEGGQLRALLADSLKNLARLTKEPDVAERLFKKSIDADRAAYAVREYAAGERAGKLKNNLAESFLELSELTNNPVHAEQFIRESIAARRVALAVPEYAKGKTRTLQRPLGNSQKKLGKLTAGGGWQKAIGYDSAPKQEQQRQAYDKAQAQAESDSDPQDESSKARRGSQEEIGYDSAAEVQEHDGIQNSWFSSEVTKYRGEASRDADTKPRGARTDVLTKRNPVLEEWEKIRETIAEEGVLVLSPDDVKAFKYKNVPLTLVDLSGIETLILSGDLRGVPDLAERVGKFPDLEFLDLRKTKIDELDIEKLPPKLHTVDLTDSVVPLPLQKRLQDHFKVRRDGIRKGLVILTDRDEQIKDYADTTLKKWVQEGASVPDSERREAGEKTRAYLWSKPNPSELDVSGHDIGEFDEDWHSMVASNELKVLRIGGNQLPELDFAKVALSPNLEIVDASNNVISHVHNADKIGRLRSLRKLDMTTNQLTLLPKGIEYAPEESTINLQGNELSLFSMIDARLIKFAQRSRLEFENSRREQRGPTIMTDRIVDDNVSIASGAFPSVALEKLDEKIPEILQVEEELKVLGEDAGARARWRDAGDIVERAAYVEALELVITSQGGPFKVGRMHRYHQFSQQAAMIACNRASTLHPLEGQPNPTGSTRPGLADAKNALRGASIVGGFIPAAGSYIDAGAKAAAMAIDAASSHYFNRFHRGFLQAFPIPEHEMLSRVLPLAMALTMGEQLVSKKADAVKKGTPRHKEPSQRVSEYFKWAAAAIKKTPPSESDVIEQRAFRDTANLLDDIATGKAFSIPDDANKAAALRGMTFDQKVEEALTYWANEKNNSAVEELPFKNRYILSDSPLVKQLATIAKNYTLNDIAQEKKIRDIERKHYDEKRKRRATTQELIDSGLFKGLELSDWDTDPEKKFDRAGKLLPSSAPADLSSEPDLSSEEDISSLGKGKEPASGTARTRRLPASGAKSAKPDPAPLLRRTVKAPLLRQTASDSTQYVSASEKPAELHQTDSDDSLYGSRAAGTEASRNQTRVLVQARGVQRRSASQNSSSRESSPHGR